LIILPSFVLLTKVRALVLSLIHFVRSLNNDDLDLDGWLVYIELILLNSHRAPVDKLHCLIQCCRALSSMCHEYR